VDETVAGGVRRSLWRPPRAHGDLIAGRTVSFLELFGATARASPRAVGLLAPRIGQRCPLRGRGIDAPGCGWLRPAPWPLVLLAILSVLWLIAVSRFLRAGARGEEPPEPQ
jgi:hypothetical protein